MDKNIDEEYSDIINLPHHISPTRKRMSIHDRAAQFSPFAALTGYDDEIDEAGRLTDDRLYIDFDEEKRENLDRKIRYMQEMDSVDTIKSKKIKVRVRYFVPDKKKDGGEYVDTEGTFKRIDISDNTFCFTDGRRIPIPDIYDISILDGTISS